MFKYFLCFTANSKALKQVKRKSLRSFVYFINEYNYKCLENDSDMAKRLSRFGVNYKREGLFSKITGVNYFFIYIFCLDIIYTSLLCVKHS